MALSENWRYILWGLDLLQVPELVPDTSAHRKSLSLSYWIGEIRAGDVLVRFISIVVISIFFLPAFLYRWSLKSTCWLYLPLIYLGGGCAGGPTRRRKRRYCWRASMKAAWRAFAVGWRSG